MARIRTIKPEFFTSDSMSEASVLARLLCVGLFTYCDDEGRGRADVRLIKGELFALDDGTTQDALLSALSELKERGTICRYTCDVEGAERAFLHFPNWSKHQRISHATPSRFPACPAHDGHAMDSGEHRENFSSEGKGREQGTGKATNAAAFEEFWKSYPRKVGKQAARREFDRALQRTDVATLITALRQQLPHLTSLEPQFIPHPRTWLSQGRWEDVPPSQPAKVTSLWDKARGS